MVNIIVTNHNEDETVEVTIQSHGMFFRAERTSDDRQTSLDLVLDVLQKQIVRNKERLEKRLKSAMDFTAFGTVPCGYHGCRRSHPADEYVGTYFLPVPQPGNRRNQCSLSPQGWQLWSIAAIG